MLTDAPVVKLSELERAIVTHIPLGRDEHAHVLLELTPAELLHWSTASPIGLVLALDIVLRYMRNKRVLSATERFAIQQLLRKGLNALKFMQEEIEQALARIASE